MLKKTKKPAKIAKQKPHTYKWTVLLSGYSKNQIEQAISQIEDSLNIHRSLDRLYMTMGESNDGNCDVDLYGREIDYNGWEENISDNGYTLFIRTKVGKYEIKAAKAIAHSFIAGWCAAKNSL